MTRLGAKIQNSKAGQKARSQYVRVRAFSLVELLFVLAIISLLAALLLPVFMTVRGSARQTVCASHLRQIGVAVAQYNSDYDGFYPYAVDPADRAAPQTWSRYPEFQAAIPSLNLLHQALQPYAHSTQIFQCPADSGFQFTDWGSTPLNATPSSFEKFGTSYYYRTEVAARHAHDSNVARPAELNLLFDGVGQWHGTLAPLMKRYNVLFADGHVKNLSYSELEQLWFLSLFNE